jgi:hypothetical protein
MVTLDRIRLTGLLRKKPWQRGFFYSAKPRPRIRATIASVVDLARTLDASPPLRERQLSRGLSIER